MNTPTTYEQFLASPELTKPYRGRHIAFRPDRGVLVSGRNHDVVVQRLKLLGYDASPEVVFGFVPGTPERQVDHSRGAPPLPQLPDDLVVHYGDIMATPNAGPENSPITICITPVEAANLFDALMLWGKRPPRHFDCSSRLHDVRDVLWALRRGMEQYPERCDVILEDRKVPKEVSKTQFTAKVQNHIQKLRDEADELESAIQSLD